MKIINLTLVASLMLPFAGMADDDDEVNKYATLNCNNTADMKILIQEQIAPYFEGLSDQRKAEVKSSMRYALSDSATDFDRLFSCLLPPFDPPNDPRQFFLWIWEELFDGEEYAVGNLKDFRVKHDFSVLHKRS